MREETKPSQKIIASPLNGQIVEDSEKRKITLKNPDVTDFYQVDKSMGNDGDIPGCRKYSMWIPYVDMIDNVKFFMPTNYNEYRAGLKLLGMHGLHAVSEAVSKTFSTEDEVNAEIKK